MTIKVKTGETILFPSVGRLNALYAYRPGALIDENANAVIAPGSEPSSWGTPVDINAHAHASRGSPAQDGQVDGRHSQGRAARVQGLLNSEMHQSANSRKDTRPSSQETVSRLRGSKGEETRGAYEGKIYPLILRDDSSRYAWMYFVSHKYDAANAFETFLPDQIVEGTPSEVAMARLDDGEEFKEGKFGKLLKQGPYPR